MYFIFLKIQKQDLNKKIQKCSLINQNKQVFNNTNGIIVFTFICFFNKYEIFKRKHLEAQQLLHFGQTKMSFWFLFSKDANIGLLAILTNIIDL